MTRSAAHPDAIVLGLGAMGAATCMHLAQRGRRVLGLDQHAVPNNLGSSHGESRVIRLCYYEHPDYVPLLRRSFELWEELGSHCGQKLLHRGGGIYMGAPEGAFISGTLRAARAYDLPHEVLDRAALQARYPMFDVPADTIGVFEPWAGAVMAEASISAFIQAALEAGASIQGHEVVRSWSADELGAEVTTDRGTYRADQLIICAGPWTSGINEDLNVPLTVTRQVLGWIWPNDPQRFAPDRFPVWGIDDPGGHFHYGFPMLPGRPGLKLARHWIGPATDPHTIDRTPTAQDRADIESLVRTTMPGAAGEILSLAVCMYTNTPDGHFLLGRHPAHERVLLAAGFSGHGFKFAPVIGEALADLVVRGRTDHPIGFLDVHRFSGKNERPAE